MPKQVRLADDVAQALAVMAADQGGSVASHANRLLRAATLGAPPARGGDTARPTQRATVSRAKGQRTAGPCPHPPGRRIGGVCMACGQPVRG